MVQRDHVLQDGDIVKLPVLYGEALRPKLETATFQGSVSTKVKSCPEGQRSLLDVHRAACVPDYLKGVIRAGVLDLKDNGALFTAVVFDR